MTKHRIERKGFYLLPYAGTRRANLVRALRPEHGQWRVRFVMSGAEGLCFLGGCTRVTPSTAKRILLGALKPR